MPSSSALAKKSGRGVAQLKRRRCRRATGGRRRGPRGGEMSASTLVEAGALLAASVPHRGIGRNVDRLRLGDYLGLGFCRVRLRLKRDEGAQTLRHRAFSRREASDGLPALAELTRNV